jgi:hypothetical protein
MSHENKLRYIISTHKSCVLQCNSKENHTWNINGHNLGRADTATHRGIKKDNKSKTGTKEVVADKIQIARRTVYALMGAGLHGLSGLNPRASIHLINCYVIPRRLYRLDVIQLSAIDVKNLNVYFNKLIKQIQHPPERTANAGALLLIGQIPIEGQIHKRMLCTFRNAIANTNSVEKNIAYRQLAIKSNDSKSWFIKIVQITQIYDLPSPYDLMETPPNKRKWKKIVTDSVNLYWSLKLKDEVDSKTTLKYLNVDDVMIDITHNIWYSGGAEPYAVNRSCVKAKLACGTYTLQKDRSKFSKHSASPTCQLCKSEHFLVKCKALEDIRTPFINKLRGYLIDIICPNLIQELLDNSDNLLQLIIDCSKFHFLSLNQQHRIEKIAAGLCFNLHQKRASLLL